MRCPIALVSAMFLLASACSNQESREVLPRPAGVVRDAPANIPSAPITAVSDRTHAAAAKTSERVVAPAAPSKGAKDDSRPFSTLEGSTVTLHPSGFTFDVPAAWLRIPTAERSTIIDDMERILGWRNRKHLSRRQLAKIEKPNFDEWDSEFGRACNAALPFDCCAAHVGSEGWGDDALRFDDLQVRVYDLPRTTSQVEGRIAKDVSAAVKTKEVRRETNGSWRRVLFSYSRRHFDYGATAHIDMILIPIGDRTLAFVFMYTSALKEPEAIPMILKSVRRGS